MQGTSVGHLPFLRGRGRGIRRSFASNMGINHIVTPIQAGVGVSADTRKRPAKKAFRHTADCDVAITSCLSSGYE